MTADELLAELTCRGVLLSVSPTKPDHLVYGPKDRAADLLPHLIEHRVALLASVPFARAACIAKIYSSVLDRTFYLASDNAIVPPDPAPNAHRHNNLAVFYAATMEQIVKANPLADAQAPSEETIRSLRLLHDVFFEFGGDIIVPAPSTESPK